MEKRLKNTLKVIGISPAMIHNYHTCALSDYRPNNNSISFSRERGVILSGGNPYGLDNMEDCFFEIHNYINKKENPVRHWGNKNIDIHSSAMIGVPGMRLYRDSEGFPRPVIHIGGVLLGEHITIGANTTIHRAVFSDTRVDSYCHIGANCNIGHNCFIGEGSMLTASICLAGSVRIGMNCWLGIGTLVVDGVKICANVKTGAGTVVTKDITEPGLYVGAPARRIKDWGGEL